MNTTALPGSREWMVPQGEAGARLDQFLARELPDFSRTRLQEFIRDGLVSLNGKTVRPRELVRKGDCIILTAPPLPKTSPPVQGDTDFAFNVLFEDDDLLVIDKPAGISVHRGAGERSATLVDSLLARATILSRAGDEARPGIVHRIDKQTSGCLAVAKTDAAHLELARQFAARTVSKIYLALVAGRLRRNAGMINEAIGRHRVHRTKMAVAREGGRAARTDYRVLRSGPEASLLECRLHSGRTHQIRVHLQHIGHPILGDTVYAGRRAGNFPRQMLHAWKLGFNHPRSKEEMHFEADLPEDFKKAMTIALG